MPNNIKLHQMKVKSQTWRKGSIMDTACEEAAFDESEFVEGVAGGRPEAKRPALRLIDGSVGTQPGAGQGTQQLALPLDWKVGGIPAQPPTPGYLRVVRDEEEQAELAALGHGRPHPVAWAAQMSRAVFEVAQGERPANQLRKHIASDQLSTLAIRGTSYARHPAARSAHGMTRLRKVRAVRCCLVAPGIVEASAVIVGAARSHAVALRMESRPQAWLVTAIEFR
jgi:hypothetical protein